MFTVIGTETYENELNKWSTADKEAAEKIPAKLKENPFAGKPLSYPFLREKKIRDKRIYYLVYEDLKLVLLVATSRKKDQQATINYLKSQLPFFREIAGEAVKQAS